MNLFLYMYLFSQHKLLVDNNHNTKQNIQPHDEPKCEELPDGSVVLSSRKGAGRFFNIYKYSDDPKKMDGVWGDVVASDQQRGGIKVGRNSTNGEILILQARRKADGAQRTLALQSLPTGDGRSDVKIYWKDISRVIT